MTMKPPPPMPATKGSVTPRTAFAAIAASTALPPSRRILIPARVASASTLATAPPVPTATASFGGCGAAGALMAPASSSVASVTRSTKRGARRNRTIAVLRLVAVRKRRPSYSGIRSGDEEVLIKSKEEKIELEGEVIEAFRNGMYKIALENGQETLGYTAGKMRRYRIKILPGDRINIELSPYDLSRGRIVYRHR